jgi:hypothetical protein
MNKDPISWTKHIAETQGQPEFGFSQKESPKI